MYGSNCSKGRGRSPRAISVSSAKGIEQLVVCRPVGEIAPDVGPSDGAVLADCEDGRLGDASLAVSPHTPLLDHMALGITEQGKRQQQLLDHGAVVLDRIDRDRCQGYAPFDEAVPIACVRGQLPVAVGSPIAAVEDEQNRSAGEVVGETPGLAFVVRQLEVGRYLHPYRNRTATINNSRDLLPEGRELPASCRFVPAKVHRGGSIQSDES